MYEAETRDGTSLQDNTFISFATFIHKGSNTAFFSMYRNFDYPVVILV